MLFNSLGRNNPSERCRVFSKVPKDFYKIDPFDPTYSKQHEISLQNNITSNDFNSTEIEDSIKSIKNVINSDNNYRNLYNGPAIPFCIRLPNISEDLGTQLEDFWLPLLKKEYERQVPGTHFKATLQGNTELKNSISIFENSNYNNFIQKSLNSNIVGYYFPTAFQEFDINSQRIRITELPKINNLDICLSGPFEIIYSLVCYPKLLFSKNNYSPILCASAFEHKDPRMVMLFKSYGPHLEFWLMTQMLTPTKTQVSEQWSGGITIYKSM